MAKRIYELTETDELADADVFVVDNATGTTRHITYANLCALVAKSLGLDDKFTAKQDKLTFDTTPVSGSSNPVTSDGIYQSQDTQNTAITEHGKAISTLQTDMDTVKTNVSTLQTDMEDLKTDKTYGHIYYDSNGYLMLEYPKEG